LMYRYAPVELYIRILVIVRLFLYFCSVRSLAGRRDAIYG